MIWRPSVLVGEVFRNLKSRQLVWVVLWATTTGLISVLAIAELDAGSRAIELRNQLDFAGANVAVVEPVSDSLAGGGLNPGRCVALNGQTGVLRAGSEGLLNQIELAKAPGSPILPVEVSGPMVAIWDPTQANHPAVSNGFWITSSLATRLGVTDDALLALAGGKSGSEVATTVQITGRFEPVRAPQMGARLIYPASPASRADRCWVEVDRPLTQDKLFGLSAWFAVDAPVLVRPLLETNLFQSDPAAQYAGRVTRQAWLAVGFVVGVLWALLLRSRRGEMALLLTLGTGRLCTVGQVVAENAVVAALAWSSGTGLALWWWGWTKPPVLRPTSVLSASITSTVLAIVLALTIATLVSFALTFGSRLQALKNRD
ncbi:MAG: FtsX-like permease family protein [Acidimicrobiia bacterium]